MRKGGIGRVLIARLGCLLLSLTYLVNEGHAGVIERSVLETWQTPTGYGGRVENELVLIVGPGSTERAELPARHGRLDLIPLGGPVTVRYSFLYAGLHEVTGLPAYFSFAGDCRFETPNLCTGEQTFYSDEPFTILFGVSGVSAVRGNTQEFGEVYDMYFGGVWFEVTNVTVPEPSTKWLLLGGVSGILALTRVRRLRRRA